MIIKCLVSHTANIIKRIGVLSFVTPKKRKAVQFTQKLLNLLNEYHPNVFYVSSTDKISTDRIDLRIPSKLVLFRDSGLVSVPAGLVMGRHDLNSFLIEMN